MFAVIETGGKQYRVAPNDVVTVEKLEAEPGSTVALDRVLMVAPDGGDPKVGTPVVADAKVSAEVVEQGHARTIRVFKKRRRKNSRRTRGHRQRHTVLRITDIELGGESLAAGTELGKAPRPRGELLAATNAAVTLRSKRRARTVEGRGLGRATEQV